MKNSSAAIVPPPADPKEVAWFAHLRYVSDDKPGIRRLRRKNGAFRYVDAAGAPVVDRATLTRIAAL